MANNEYLKAMGIITENCSRCGKEISTEEYVNNGGMCENCIQNNDSEIEEIVSNKKGIKGNLERAKFYTYKQHMRNTENMILTTTNEIKGYNITEYIGVVAGTDIYLIGGVLGGGMANQENLYTEALARATTHLRQNAEVMGANGVIGIQSNMTSTGGTNNLILTLTGTAVKIDNSGTRK